MNMSNIQNAIRAGRIHPFHATPWEPHFLAVHIVVQGEEHAEGVLEVSAKAWQRCNYLRSQERRDLLTRIWGQKVLSYHIPELHEGTADIFIKHNEDTAGFDEDDAEEYIAEQDEGNICDAMYNRGVDRRLALYRTVKILNAMRQQARRDAEDEYDEYEDY